jgi:hypothetical protein
MPLEAHTSLPPKKQLIGCDSKFLGEEDAFTSRFGVTRCTNCGKATFWCMCRVESLVCFRCGRLGHLVKLCPSLAFWLKAALALPSEECGSYARIYVVEDLGYVVNMVKEAISREVANLFPPKSSTFSGQLPAETVCSSMVCPLTPSNAEVRQTTSNIADAATCTTPLCCSIVCIWLIWVLSIRMSLYA